jgi:CcmD family protein
MNGSLVALYLAYSIAWVGVFAYLLYMHIRQRSVERDIRSLREEVRKHGQ